MYKKKVRKTLKEIINQLVAILTVLSKLYEKILFKQIASFFEKIFSKNCCGFSKGCNTPQCLLVKKCADGVLAFGYLLTEVLKAFDCLDHERIIAKLNSCEFSWLGLKLTHDYLSNRKQRKRENNSYIKWISIMFGVAQGPILRPLLFNIFLGNLFVLHQGADIANFAESNTPYTSAKNIDVVIEFREESWVSLFKWFESSFLKDNADKCHFLKALIKK